MKHYSTFEVAEILGVTPHTVINWSKKGYLTCFKTPGGHRRYNQDIIIQFAKNRGIQLFQEPDTLSNLSTYDIFLLEQDESFGNFIKEIIDDAISNQVFFTSNVIEAIYLIGYHQPKIVLFDCNIQNPTAIQIVRMLKKQNKNIFSIGLLTSLQQKNFLQDDFDEIFLKSASIVSLIHLIERILTRVVPKNT